MVWNFEYSSRKTINVQQNQFNTIIHTCKLCKYFTKSLVLIRNHIKRHRKVNNLFSCSANTPEAFHCRDCGFTTYLTYEFMHHVNNHTHQRSIKFFSFDKEPETFFCYYCDFKTKLLAIFVEHVINHVSLTGDTEKEFYCTKCQLHTTDVLSWIRHFYCNEENIVIKQEPLTADAVFLQFEVIRGRRGEIKWFKCDKCFYQTHSREILHKHHIHNHSVKSKSFFRCKQCSFATSLKKSLSVHRKRHSIQPKLFQCSRCNYFTESKDDILQHSEIHMLPEFVQWFTCDFCSFKSKDKYYYCTHIRTHSSPKEMKWYECGKCAQKYSKKKFLELHKCRYKKVKFQCDKCSFKTRLKRRYDKHKKRHLMCDEPLMEKLKLKAFPKTQQKCQINFDKVSQCGKCSLSHHEAHTIKHEFETDLPKTRQSSRRPCQCHLQNHKVEINFKNVRHPQQKKFFQCEECSFKTILKNRYQEHMKKHKVELLPPVENNEAPLETVQLEPLSKSRLSLGNPFKCDLCTFKAYLPFNLKNHIREKHLETNVSQYHCEQCSYTCTNKKFLQKHLTRKHTQFQCKKCPYKSSTETKLLKHSLKEHLINWLRCDQCSYRTKSDYILRRHKANKHFKREIPLNERHICASCDYKTKDKWKLKKHLMKKHPTIDHVKYFHCDYCSYKTYNKFNFNRHNLHMHKRLDEITSLNGKISNFETKTKQYFQCYYCSYKTFRKYDFDRHLFSKHTPLD